MTNPAAEVRGSTAPAGGGTIGSTEAAAGAAIQPTAGGATEVTGAAGAASAVGTSAAVEETAGGTSAAAGAGRKPDWLKVSVPPARAFRATARVLDDLDLHTVCSEARCPNKGECFAAGTATFLILGDRCTRDCRFCSVRHGAPDGEPDADEPRRVAAAATRLELRHVVVTSVTRDDLADGGAAQFAAVIGEVRAALPDATIEVLTPDFGGDEAALRAVLVAAPDVFNHNLETVPRLYSHVRPAADYDRSLEVLSRAAQWPGAATADPARRAAPSSSAPHAHPARRAAQSSRGAASGGAWRPVVKTGLMLGLGETRAEVEAVLRDAHGAGVEVVTLGQYLRPAPGCLPVARYVTPEEFAEWTSFGESVGLVVVAGPFVRSSYRAGEALARVAGSQARGRGS